MMKPLAVLLMFVAGWPPAFAADLAGKARAGNGAESNASFTEAPVSQQMKITIGKRVFTATLQDNAAAVAFKAMLPLSLNMHDVNRNEKAFDLPSDLPTSDANPRRIRPGDLMIWNSRTVVLFYKGFSTPYSYTRLGKIEDPDGLAEVLGAGDVTVAFARSCGCAAPCQCFSQSG
jgi:hypothetical protein